MDASSGQSDSAMRSTSQRLNTNVTERFCEYQGLREGRMPPLEMSLEFQKDGC